MSEDDIVSAASISLDDISPDEKIQFFGINREFSVSSDGDIIEGEIIDSRSEKSRLKSERPEPSDRTATGGIPSINEWMTFFGKVVIRVATDWYIDWAFRGIDEDLLSDREVDRIKLSDDERDRIARPFAELAYKTKWTRKHGRTIIAASESLDALLQMGLWFSRVSRIAMKYRQYSQSGQRSRPQTAYAPPYVPSPSQDGGGMNERPGQGPQAESNGHDRNWRPGVNGYVVNNDLG